MQGLKPISIEISNIGLIRHEIIQINKPLILFFGDLQQGKTTILNSFRLCFGGSYPQDLITHDEKEAFIHFTFNRGSLRREFYISKDGTIKDRPIQLVLDGKVESKPISIIKQFLNPFLLNQNYLIDMSETDLKKFFVEFLGIDTSKLDTEYAKLEAEAKDLRVEIKAHGDIDLTPVELPNIGNLKLQKNEIIIKNNELKKQYKEQYENVAKGNIQIINLNSIIENKKRDKINNDNKINDLIKEIASLQDRIIGLKEKNNEIDEYLISHQIKEQIQYPLEPEYFPTTEIDEKLSQANADQVRYEAYLKRREQAEEKQKKENLLKLKTDRQRAIKAEKITLLAQKSEESKIENLRFDEDGNSFYKNTSLSMLSTSQKMELSSKISNLYPQGFGLELIDRGESLFNGRSGIKNINEFSERAKKYDLTILATIVSEEPAENIPEEVGIFIVENGKIK